MNSVALLVRESREKKTVLRGRDVEGDLERMATRREVGRAFPRQSPMVVNYLVI